MKTTWTNNFRITKPGLYKTRNGRKAHVYRFIDKNHVEGAFEHVTPIIVWDANNGRTHMFQDTDDDLVDYWKEEHKRK